MEPILPRIDVSIIIVNYNSFEILSECLRSLFKFCIGTSNEVIVIDNASTQGNVESVINNYNNINLVKNKTNLGFAAANNIGLKYAHGKYTLFLNNDTVFLDDSIKKVFDYSESSSENRFVGIQLLNSDGSRQESVVQFPSLWNTITENFFLYKLFPKSILFNKYYQNCFDYNEPVEVDVIRGAFMFCPTEQLTKLDGFDERFFFFSEETDMCKRFKDSGGKVIFYPVSSVIHYSGATADLDMWFKFKNQTTGKIQYYQKHFKGIMFFFAILVHYSGLLLRGFLFAIGGVITANKKLILKGYYFFGQLFVYPKNQF
ncbi:MAG: glycosyltransferase family 2 protein [Melioribacteraceae bacterium]|nr:glycosyltransferase family 2 protein [Melioribacteraceae bacterium]